MSDNQCNVLQDDEAFWWQREENSIRSDDVEEVECLLVHCNNFLRSIRTTSNIDDCVRENAKSIHDDVTNVLKKCHVQDPTSEVMTIKGEYIGCLNADEIIGSSPVNNQLGLFVVLWNSLQALTDVHATKAFDMDEDWDLVGLDRSVLFPQYYRNDGKISPCSKEAYMLWEPHYSARMPPCSKFHVVPVGKRKVLVFHFRSGFVIRVDDHEKMMHLVTVFMSEALDKGTLSNINRVPIWKGLLAIFWPGPSSIGMTGVDKKLPYPIPSPFLQKRLMVAMDYLGLLWDRALKVLGGQSDVEKFKWQNVVIPSENGKEEVLRCEIERCRFLETVDHVLGHSIRIWMKLAKYNDRDVTQVMNEVL